jgi:hypothetical protein
MAADAGGTKPGLPPEAKWPSNSNGETEDLKPAVVDGEEKEAEVFGEVAERGRPEWCCCWCCEMW